MSDPSTLNSHSVAQVRVENAGKLRHFVSQRRTLGRRGIGIAFAEPMIFATYWFLAFAILSFPIFWLCRRPTLHLGLLLVVSAVFHTHYSGPAGVMPIVAMGVIVYIIGLSDNRAANAVGIILCVLMLVGYKYLVFLSANLLGMFHALP